MKYFSTQRDFFQSAEPFIGKALLTPTPNSIELDRAGVKLRLPLRRTGTGGRGDRRFSAQRDHRHYLYPTDQRTGRGQVCHPARWRDRPSFAGRRLGFRVIL